MNSTQYTRYLAGVLLGMAALTGCAAHRQDSVIDGRADTLLGAWQAGSYDIMYSQLGPSVRKDVSKRKFIAMQQLIEQASGRLKSYRTTSLTPAWKQGDRLFAPALEAEGDEAVRNYHLDFERGEGQLVLGLRLRNGGIEITRYEFWIPRLFEPAYKRRFDEIQAMTD